MSEWTMLEPLQRRPGVSFCVSSRAGAPPKRSAHSLHDIYQLVLNLANPLGNYNRGVPVELLACIAHKEERALDARKWHQVCL